MANVQIEYQLQDVAQVVRRCPMPTLIGAYVRAARKFCTETRWLRREIVGATAEGVSRYFLGTDDLLEIVGIRAMTAILTDRPNQRWPMPPTDPTRWPTNAGPGRPTTYCYIPEGGFAVARTPDAIGYTLTVTAECTPKRGVQTLPEELLVAWDRAFADGATEYLLNIPKQPWSNPTLAAAKYGRDFKAAINNAKGQVQRAFNTGTTVARVRKLF